MSGGKPLGLGQSTCSYVMNNETRIRMLPRPPETFAREDMPEPAAEIFAALHSKEIIEHAGRHDEKERWDWQLTEDVATALKRLDEKKQNTNESGPLTPCCEYRGWRNLRDGDYQCKLCGDEFAAFSEADE